MDGQHSFFSWRLRGLAALPLAQSLFLIFCLSLGACTGPGKQETAALVVAVEGFRHADAASRASRAEGVSAVACTDARVCDAKRACVDAIEPTTRALALKDEVALRLADIEQKRLAPDAPEAQSLPGKLDEAERLLQGGREKMTDCERKLGDLRIEHGV